MTDSNDKKDDSQTTAIKAVEKKKSKTTLKKISKKSASNTGPYLIIFLLIIASAAGLYWLWEKQQQYVVTQSNRTTALQQTLLKLEQQQANTELKNTQLVQEIHSNQETLHNNLGNLIRNNQHLRKDWLLAEAEYLIQLANYRLLLEKDVETAVVALQTADSRLNETANPAVIQIRETLAEDIQRLSNIPKIDLAGLSLVISTLSKNITNLPLNVPDPKSHKLKAEEKTKSTTEVNSIKDLPAAIWRDIKSLIIIRNHEKPLEPLLAPSQQYFLEQNLALMLEQTRLALLNLDNVIYQERLATTKEWLNEYFDTEHNVTRNMLANIDELQKIDINPSLPDISSSYTMIKKYRKHGQQPKIIKKAK